MAEPSALDLRTALGQAQQAGLARIDAQMLLLHCLGRPKADRAWLISHDSDLLQASQRALFTALCARRLAGEPVAYLTGYKAFYGMDLQVDARVLDPRDDTETLVDWALQLYAQPQASPRVLDLGTGSGAIALAFQQQRPASTVWAVDASADALQVARANAQALALPVHFAHGHWFGAVADQPRFDLVLSNPPYVRSDDPHLAALRHEPLSALTSGPDGLDDLRSIIATAPAHLTDSGWLLLEHGWDQGEAVAALLHGRGFVEVQHRQDLAGITRCTGARWSA